MRRTCSIVIATIAFARHAAAAIAVTLCFILASTAALAQITPAVWKTADDDTTIYIMGTIHFMTPETQWLNDDIRDRFDAADGLVLEINLLDNNQMSIQQMMQENGFLEPGDSLQNYLSDEAYAALLGITGPAGVPEQMIQRMRPWLAMLQMAALAAERSGFLPNFGVDITLMTLANQSGKPLTGLETAEYQIGIFAGLSDAEAAELIELGYEDSDDLQTLFIDMRDKWLAGETDELAELINADFGEQEKFLNLLLWQRNRNWADRIGELMAEPGTYFIAVGAGHLAGPNNLIQLLEDGGLAVSRE